MTEFYSDEQLIESIDSMMDRLLDSVDHMDALETDEIYKEMAGEIDPGARIYYIAYQAKEEYERSGKPVPLHVSLALNSAASSAPDLKYAAALIRGASVAPEAVRVRIIKIASVSGMGVVGLGLSLWAVWAGFPQTESGRLLSIFFLFSSLALTLTCFVGLLLTIWSGYVYEHVRAEQAKVMLNRARQMVRGALALGSDATYLQDVVRLVVAELANWRANNPAAGDVAVAITAEPKFQERIRDIQRSALVRNLSRQTASEPLDDQVAV